jgi:uncharacterized protein YjdB
MFNLCIFKKFNIFAIIQIEFFYLQNINKIKVRIMMSHDYINKVANIVLILYFCITFPSVHAQVSNVKYQIKYNTDSCWYDAFLIISGGSASNITHRTQDYSKFSVLVPAGTNINVLKNYMPLENNQTYTGTVPVNWIISGVVGAPTIEPDYDFYMFSPSLDSLSHYNNLNTGDTIKLFSLSVDTIFDCGSGIRIFENGTDPGPMAPGMGYVDFTNQLNLIGSSVIYDENALQINPPLPVFTNLLLPTCDNGIEIDISPLTTVCQEPLKYEWSGPNNFSSISQDVSISPATTAQAGIYKIIVMDAIGCSDSLSFNAYNKPSAGDDQVVCANSETTLNGTNPANGIWSALPSNPVGSIMTNLSPGTASVIFDQTASGTYKFIYTTFFCSDTLDILVLSSPVVGIVGDTSICVGTSTTLSPDAGGFWTSEHPMIASVTNDGHVTGLGDGTTQFTFTDTATGCYATTDSVTIHALPIVSVSGTPNVCIGSTTILTSNGSGVWECNLPLVASVNNTGEVSGFSEGNALITFTDTINGCASLPVMIMVLPVPAISLTGNNVVCTDAQTTLSPVSGGSWLSLDPDVAIVTDSGRVTGVSAGTVGFIYTETSTGCSSDTSDIITILPKPLVSLSSTELCEGNTAILNPNTGGTWVSNNPLIASAGLTTGVITGTGQGNVTFTFTIINNGCSATTDTLYVNARPQLSASPSTVCIGSVTELAPSSGGIWTSLDNDIAVVNNSTAAGIGSGIVTLSFTDNNSGCQNTINIIVTERAAAMITGDEEICPGLTSQLSPSSGGTWTSSNSSVATVNNEGIIAGISDGMVVFTFTESATGCNSLPTSPLIVHPVPAISLTGLSQICIGSTTTMSPESGGIWTSNNENTAIIDVNSGLITGMAGGTATFTFTSNATGCVSLPSTPVLIFGETLASIAGPAIICTGGSTFLSPSTGGIWTSGDLSVATVSNSGVVSGTGSGLVNFTFTETANGCGYTSITSDLMVTQCFNPDFNITSKNVLVYGNVATNDHDASGNIYNPGLLSSSPPGSNPVLQMNPDGSYSFLSDSVGQYIYSVPVCIPPLTINCPESELIITVVKHLSSQKTVSANVDLAVTMINTTISIPSLQNDACVLVGGCNLDPASVHILNFPAHGSTTINTTTGNIIYTPDPGYIGIDTLIYEVCVSAQPSNCSSAKQIISIINTTSVNSTYATDDLYIGSKNKIINGNVLLNDMDAESDQQAVTSQQLSVVNGDFTLNPDGSFSFAPASEFIGTIEFVYEVCDNHVPGYCQLATLHIHVFPDLGLNIRAYLEGSLMNNANATAGGRPLMRDNLRMSPFNGSRYIPDSSPYRFPTDFINITNKYNHVGPGLLPEFQNITNPSTVFGVTGQNAIVDWVFLELRSKVNQTTIWASRAGLIQRDGDIVDLDGVSPIEFPGTPMDDYYVVLRHRSHLGVMTATAKTPEQMSALIDFTSPTTPVFDFGTTKGNGYDYTGVALNPHVKSGFMALYAGDFDANKKIKTENPNDDLNSLFFGLFSYPGNTTSNANYDFAIGYLQGDFDMNSKAKFDNPNDDKNMLYVQLLFYPVNIQFLSNFNFFIEQIP